MKTRSLGSRFVLAALVLTAPSLWAQDGLSGAVSRLQTAPVHLYEPIGQRLAIADLDNDQKPDGAVLLDSGQLQGEKSFRIELHVTAHNDSALSFESNEPALAIAALDVDQDGTPDIIVEQPFTHKRLHIWLNDGHGSFHQVRIEDFPAAGRDGPHQLKLPFLGQPYLALYLPTKLGSELAFIKAVGPSVAASATAAQVWPITSPAQTRSSSPNPSRGPPSFLSL